MAASGIGNSSVASNEGEGGGEGQERQRSNPLPARNGGAQSTTTMLPSLPAPLSRLPTPNNSLATNLQRRPPLITSRDTDIACPRAPHVVGQGWVDEVFVGVACLGCGYGEG